MSHRSIAEMKYQDWLERDQREGTPDTAERRKFLWELADDYAYEMQQDAEMSARGEDEERHAEESAEEPDDYPGDETFA
jgi:hypothetical protein